MLVNLKLEKHFFRNKSKIFCRKKKLSLHDVGIPTRNALNNTVIEKHFLASHHFKILFIINKKVYGTRCYQDVRFENTF